MIPNFDVLSDMTENTTTRFCTFTTPSQQRFDLAITKTSRFYGKKLVTDFHSGISAIIGIDDLQEQGYISHIFNMDSSSATELSTYLEFLFTTDENPI